MTTAAANMKHYEKLPPAKVWVGEYEFDLSVVPRSHDELQPDQDDEPGCKPHDGVTLYDETTILIANDLNPTGLLETIWHELTHAVNHAAGIEDGADEETIAGDHGKVWTQFWLVNPRFQRWWNAQCVALRKRRAKGA
jgi:hypothetical protein